MSPKSCLPPSCALALAGCATPLSVKQSCAAARNAVYWADIALPLACTKQSKACDTAGLVLKAAHTAEAAICPPA